MSIPNNLKGRRRAPNPKDIKKHSDIVRKGSNPVVVGGARVKTDTGFIVPGFSGKSFETYYEVMLAGTSTHVLRHEKKDRTLRILAGTAFVVVDDQERRVLPGDEVILSRGTSYRVATTNEKLEMFVCQQAKYDAQLEVLEKVITPVTVPPEMLETPSFQDRVMAMRPAEVQQVRRGSKAREQLAASRGGRTSPQVQAKAVNAVAAPEFAPSEQGLNAKPTGGRFDDAGAG